jgi:hypothetical protein
LIEDDATVERLAREICRTHGRRYVDPDQLVSFGVPAAIKTPWGDVYAVPRAEATAPLWTQYSDVARLAIRQAKAAEKGEAA